MTQPLLSRLRRFAGDTQGNVTIETVIWVPLLLSILAAVFTLHDVYRQQALNTKAAYTISDALSRETDPIDGAYIDGMVDLLAFLTRSSSEYSLRVTLVRFDNPPTANADGSYTYPPQSSGTYEVDWSEARGEFTALTDTDLVGMSASLPNMLHNERVIFVETRADYTAPFNILGLNDSDLFYTYGFTRPRFAPKIVWAEGTS
jgi:hypothetical protein